MIMIEPNNTYYISFVLNPDDDYKRKTFVIRDDDTLRNILINYISNYRKDVEIEFYDDMDCRNLEYQLETFHEKFCNVHEHFPNLSNIDDLCDNYSTKDIIKFISKCISDSYHDTYKCDDVYIEAICQGSYLLFNESFLEEWNGCDIDQYMF